MTNPQVNHITKQPYKGGNQITLQAIAGKSKFYSNEWLTFLQAKGISRRIKNGSKGVRIVAFVKTWDKDLKREVDVPRYYTVFNFDQTSNDLVALKLQTA